MDKDFVNIEVNGKALQAPRGKMIIEVTDAEAVYIPRFCYHPKLSIAANCRMCLVEVEGAPKPLPACATPIMEGMKIHTRSPRAIAAQRATMEFLLINHPLDCPICDQGGECELQDIAMGFGSDVSRFTERKRIVKDKNLGPLVSTDMTRCIHCTRCVRFGQEIAGIQELGTLGRGESTEIGTFLESNVDHELSGNIIDVCPVGALNNKPYRYRARAWEMIQRDTVSPHDCAGAQLYTHTLRGKVMRNVPRNCEEINETWAADRDRYGCHGLYSPDRLEHPMIRGVDGEWREATWEEALTRTVEGLKAARAELTGFLATPGATLEEHYLLAQVARRLGSPNLDHRLRRSDFSGQDQDALAPGIGMPMAEIAGLSGLLLIGSDLRREAPILAHRVRHAALRGTHIGFLNPAGFEWRFPVAAEVVAPFAAQAEALAKVLAAACDGDFAGLPDALVAQLKALEPGPGDRALAEVLMGSGPRAVWLGLLAQRHPGFADLHVLATALCVRTGATLGSLGEGANSAGACLAGVLPHREVGGRPAPQAGLDTSRMLCGELDALVMLGIEPEYDTASGAAALTGLASTDFVVCMTPWVTATMRDYASVLLPVGTAYETSGTFVNCEGRRQGFAGAARPVGEARPAWKVLRVLGNHLDLEGFDYQSSADVLAEFEAVLADADADNVAVPPVTLRTVELRHTGEIEAPGMYATDMLLRRSRPLQETAEGLRGGRRWS